MRIYLLFVALFYSSLSLGQTTGAEIGFKDFHSSQISALHLYENGDYLLAGDLDGRILIWDAQTGNFSKALKNASGEPIQSLVARKNVLMASAGPVWGSFRNKEDSAFVANIQTAEIVHRTPGKIRWIDLGRDDYFGGLLEGYEDDTQKFPTTYFTLFDGNAQNVSTISVPHNVRPAVSPDLKVLVYISMNQIKWIDLKTGDEMQTLTLPESLKPTHVFFNTLDGELYVVAFSKSKNETGIYRPMIDKSWENPLYTAAENLAGANLSTRIDDGKMIIVLGNVRHPKVLVLENDRMRPLNFNPEGPKTFFDKAVIDTKNKRIYLTDHDLDPLSAFMVPSNASRPNIARIYVYDYKNEKLVGVFPEFNADFYAAAFLSDDSWLAMPGRLHRAISDEKIKYFETGTFQNRFHNLDLLGYLQAEFGVEIRRAYWLENTDWIVALGYSGNSRDYSFFAYNLVSDQLDTVIKLDEMTAFQDFNPSSKLLLMADDFYPNMGNEFVKFRLLSPNDPGKDLPGKYQFGRFSQDGDFLLTIDSNNLIEVRRAMDLNVIYSLQSEVGSFGIFPVDEKNFMVNVQLQETKHNGCSNETIILNFSDENYPEIQQTPCVSFTSVDSKNGKSAFIVNGTTVGFENKTKIITGSGFPLTVSLNEDASKMMVSFSNGEVTVFDTQSLTPLVHMFHPDHKTQLFWDEDNHYFSNFDPSQFLFAISNGKQVPLTELGREIMAPDKILAEIGMPNPAYLEELNKAMTLRESKFFVSDDHIAPLQKKQSTSFDEDSELYLLSVGVSDYRDDAWSLTLPDKDATDIAMLYGEVSPEVIKAYKERFFGNGYSLNNWVGNPAGSIYIYRENPLDYPNFLTSAQIADNRGQKWLVADYGKALATYTLYDFGTGESRTYNSPFHSTGMPQVYPAPDGSGFFMDLNSGSFMDLKDEPDEFYRFRFGKDSFEKINRPFSRKTGAEIRLLNTGEWLETDYEGYRLFDSKGQQREEFVFPDRVEFTYKSASDNGIQTGTLDYPTFTFNGVSPDGGMLFFSRETDGVRHLFTFERKKGGRKWTRLPITLGIGAEVRLNDDQKIAVLERNFDRDQIEIRIFDFKGNLIAEENIKTGLDLVFPRNSKLQLSVGNLNFIRQEDGLLKEGFYQSENWTELANSKPASFKKVHTLLLTDDQADSKAVRKALKTFFAGSKKNDQVMIFLAGHGLLNEEDEYFFAPADMDFENVGKNGIAFGEIVQSLQDASAEHKFLLMDACHSGQTLDLETVEKNDRPSQTHDQGKRGSRVVASTRPNYKTSEIISAVFEDFLSHSGVTILSAASGGDLAQENPAWGGGAFTQSFINTLLVYLKYNELKNFDSSIIRLKENDLANKRTLSDGFIESWFQGVIKTTKGQQIPDLREKSKDKEIRLW